MTPRQQEASTLRKQGLTQAKIGVLMGICQSRVSALLRLNAGQSLKATKYLKTEAGKAVTREQSRRWLKANREKVNARVRLHYAANRKKILEKNARYFRTEKGREVKRRSARKWAAVKRLYQKVLDFQGATG